MCNIFHQRIFWTSTTNTLQHLILMSPPSCCHAATTQHSRCHRNRCAAATTPILPCCCPHTAATTMLVLPLCCHLCSRVATTLPPPPLPPRCHHRCRRRCQAAAAAAKLPPSSLSTLWDRFDDEKELCKMTGVDFFQLSQLFQLGIKFLHGGMLSIFDALVYLSLNRIHL